MDEGSSIGCLTNVRSSSRNSDCDNVDANASDNFDRNSDSVDNGKGIVEKKSIDNNSNVQSETNAQAKEKESEHTVTINKDPLEIGCDENSVSEDVRTFTNDESSTATVSASELAIDDDSNPSSSFNMAHIDLSIVKSEPEDPIEVFDYGQGISASEEVSVMDDSCNSNNDRVNIPDLSIVKTEPIEEEKASWDCASEVRFRVGRKVKMYSREQLHAAKLISQSTLAIVVDMSMFENVAKSMPTVKLKKLEDSIKNMKNISPSDFDVVYKFCMSYGRDPAKWTQYFGRNRKSGKQKQAKHIPEIRDPSTESDNCSLESEIVFIPQIKSKKKRVP